MKTILCAIAAVVATAWAVSEANPPDANPPNMSIRLELFVNNVENSAEFYTSVLGFERLDGNDDYLPIRSGTVVIGLGPVSKLPQRHYFNPEVQESRRGLGTEIVLEVDDVHALFEKVKATGYKILTPLQKRSWGATDFRLADPDGYYLRLTSR